MFGLSFKFIIYDYKVALNSTCATKWWQTKIEMSGVRHTCRATDWRQGTPVELNNTMLQKTSKRKSYVPTVPENDNQLFPAIDEMNLRI